MVRLKLHGLLRAAVGTDSLEVESGEEGVLLEDLLGPSGALSKAVEAGVPLEYWTIVIDGRMASPSNSAYRRSGGILLPDGSTVDLFVAVEGG